MSTEGDVPMEETPVVEVVEQTGPMTPEDALQEVLRKALIHDALARGIREAVKALDRRQGVLCVLNEACTEGEYVKLIEALCKEHSVPLFKVNDNKKLGEWAGLCKIDREGNPVKVVGCSCAVVRDYGEESHALNVLMEHLNA